jgi:ABC-2 type transport system ATP-binding protein
VLDSASLDPASLVLREPSLDDVFLELTGHVAEETPGDDDDAPPAKSRRGARGRQS